MLSTFIRHYHVFSILLNLIPLHASLAEDTGSEPPPSLGVPAPSRFEVGGDDVATALDILGYSVRVLPDGRLVALDGDVARHPEELLSQPERPVGGDGGLWRDVDGRPLLRYRLHSDARPALAALSEALNDWTKETCLRVVRLPDGDCGQNAADALPELCVGNFTGCWSYEGTLRTGGDAAAAGSTQFLSLEPARCGPAAVVHQLGHTLGLHHQHQRPDRHQFLHLRPEHTPVRRLESGGRRQAGVCPPRRLAAPPPPAPYDFLSVMQLRSAAFADEDQRAVLVTRDGQHQHLLDYGVMAGLGPSHFDRDTIHALYGCQRTQRRTCAALGQPAPRCKNFGYLGTDCRCRCPPTHDGAECERRFYVPSLPHTVLVEVNSSQTVLLADQGLTASAVPGAREDFQYIQFITVTAIAPKDSESVSVSLWLDPGALRRLASQKCRVTSLLANMSNEHELLLLLWGDGQRGRLRSESFSSVARNESAGPVLRSRWSRLDLTASSGFGRLLHEPQATVRFLESLSMEVTFLQRPNMELRVLHEPPMASTTTEGNVGDGEGEAQRVWYTRRLSSGEKLVIAVGGITLSLLVVLICFVTANFFCGEARAPELRP